MKLKFPFINLTFSSFVSFAALLLIPTIAMSTESLVTYHYDASRQLKIGPENAVLFGVSSLPNHSTADGKLIKTQSGLYFDQDEPVHVDIDISATNFANLFPDVFPNNQTQVVSQIICLTAEEKDGKNVIFYRAVSTKDTPFAPIGSTIVAYVVDGGLNNDYGASTSSTTPWYTPQGCPISAAETVETTVFKSDDEGCVAGIPFSAFNPNCFKPKIVNLTKTELEAENGLLSKIDSGDIKIHIKK